MNKEIDEQGKLWQYDDYTLLAYGNGDYTCSSFMLLDGSPMFASPEYADYSQCRCSEHWFGEPPDHCRPCPEFSRCWNGYNVSWPQGYYPVLDDSGIYYIFYDACCTLISVSEYRNYIIGYITVRYTITLTERRLQPERRLLYNVR